MNLRGLKHAYEMAQGNMFFLVDSAENKELKTKLFTPPIQGMLDAYPSKTPDGRDIVILPKTSKNDSAFRTLEIVAPKSEQVKTVVTHSPEVTTKVVDDSKKEELPVEESYPKKTTTSKNIK